MVLAVCTSTDLHLQSNTLQEQIVYVGVLDSHARQMWAYWLLVYLGTHEQVSADLCYDNHELNIDVMQNCSLLQ